MRTYEHLDDDLERVDQEKIDCVTWMVMRVKNINDTDTPLVRLDFTKPWFDKPYGLVEAILDPDSIEQWLWKREIWSRFQGRSNEDDTFFQVWNKPTEVQDIRVQKCMIGVTGNSYADNIEIAKTMIRSFPKAQMFELGSDNTPSARFRVLKHLQPEAFAKFSTARDDDFHTFGHGNYGGHIMYFPPLLHPVAIVTKRAAILPHPTDFTDIVLLSGSSVTV